MLDATREQEVAAYAEEVCRALGDACVGVILYGSAAGRDWIPERSDVNTVIVLRRASVAALDTLVPVIAAWRRRGFALPVVLDDDQVERARQLFPMELDDIRRQHRLLAGADPFAGIAADEAALRRECAQEAFGKLLRLRAFYLEHHDDGPALGRMMSDSIKSFLIVVRHLLRIRGSAVPPEYDAALTAAEAVLGPLPAMRAVLAQRGAARPDAALLRRLAGDYVAEVERVTAAVTAYCA
jgi:predicted nucleotidyltransferase